MDEERGSQKEIAQRYLDRVDYSHTKSRTRQWRFWLSCFVAIGGLVAIFLAQKKTPPAFFNTGPLSRSHRALENDCAACHQPESLTGGPSVPSRVMQVLERSFSQRRAVVRADRSSPARMSSATQFSRGECGRGSLLFRLSRRTSGTAERCAVVTTLDCASCHNDRASHAGVRAARETSSASAFSLESESGGRARDAAEHSKAAPAGGWLHGDFRFFFRGPSGVSTAARERARAGCVAIQSSTASRQRRHSADEKRKEAGLRFLSPTGAERPLHAPDNFRGELPAMPRAAIRCEKSRPSNCRTAMRRWCGLSCARCPRNTANSRGAKRR